MNYNVKLNLLKLKKAGVLSIQGRSEVQKCLVIPIEENNLFVSCDDSNKAKGVYLDLTAWAMQNQQYGDSHLVKQSLPKEARERMTEDEKRNMPILGSMREFENNAQSQAADTNAPFAQVENYEDLPF